MGTILSSKQQQDLQEIVGGAIAFDEPLSRHTTLKIGGPADAWVTPSSVEELVQTVRYCISAGIPMLAFGGGSNVLVRDGGIRGVVLSTRGLRELSLEGDLGIAVSAGVSTGKLLSRATKWELGGLEFLGGVPGSVGGGLVMNAGTYLGEFKDVVVEVRSIRLHDGADILRNHSQCGFVYRGSTLPSDEIVVEARLQLVARSSEEISQVVRALKQRRKEREPSGASNAGSVFKNPEGDYSGRLLESVGYKGTRVGAAECSPAHANWFVNHGGATAADMLTLIAGARQKVHEAHGIELVLEWKCIGED